MSYNEKEMIYSDPYRNGKLSLSGENSLIQWECIGGENSTIFLLSKMCVNGSKNFELNSKSICNEFVKTVKTHNYIRNEISNINMCVSDMDKKLQLPFAFYFRQSQFKKRHCLLVINLSLRKNVDNEDSDCLISSMNGN